MKTKYEERNFTPATLATIQKAEEIITEYQAAGFSLTLRQIYYQFVARGLIANTEQSYKRIGDVVSAGRRAGLLDWEAIEDRTRYLRRLSSWSGPRSILESARDSFHLDLWSNQARRVEVWVEKDALVGIMERVCNENDVPFFSCRGYVSDSEMYVGAMRIRRHYREGQSTLLLHLGDHDPSGIDMTRDITERLDLFTRGRTGLEVRRIALTMEQIDDLQPPPNPAKVTDSRYQSYCDLYGEESWELDALDPQYLYDLVLKHILEEREADKWDARVNEQEEQRERLTELMDELEEDE